MAAGIFAEHHHAVPSGFTSIWGEIWGCNGKEGEKVVFHWQKSSISKYFWWETSYFMHDENMNAHMYFLHYYVETGMLFFDF